MKNPWEYMSTKNTSKKTSGKNNDSEEENVDGSKPDDLQILKLIKVHFVYSICIIIVFAYSSFSHKVLLSKLFLL